MPQTLIQRLEKFNATRIPELVAVKYSFMAENMFRFYRGTCHLFYEDLARAKVMPAAPAVWICGDLHLENYGSFKGDNRLVYFDLNDFDEAVLAPATWELSRMVTSILLAFETLKIDERKAVKMAQLFLRSYAATLARGKAYYIEPKTAKGIVCTFLSAISKRKQERLLKKRTVKKKDQVQWITDDPRHIEIKDQFLKKELMHHMAQWLQYEEDGPFNYEPVDVVFRIAGTGSVGLRRYAFLLKSRNSVGTKYLLVDMKQAVASSLAPFVAEPQPEWENDALRIVSIQQRMQNVPPALLGTTIFKGDNYILQEMQPEKDSINFNLIKDRYRDIYQVIDDMAMLTASAQLRSTGRQGSAIADELIAFGTDGSWQEPILQYAIAYAKQVKRDYKTYVKAYKAGKVTSA